MSHSNSNLGAAESDTFFDPVEDGQGDNHRELTPEELVRRQEEWKQELAKTEEEIDTLRRVLSSKLRHAQELKRKLGITVWQEVQSDLADGLKIVKETPVYQKTSETFKSAAEKSGAMFQSFSEETRKKMGELRNSNAFKSVEGAVNGAVATVKTKVSEVATPSAERERTNFESELNKVTPNGGGSTPATPS